MNIHKKKAHTGEEQKKRDKFHQMNKTKQAKVKKLPYMRPEFIISLHFCTKKKHTAHREIQNVFNFC